MSSLVSTIAHLIIVLTTIYLELNSAKTKEEVQTNLSQDCENINWCDNNYIVTNLSKVHALKANDEISNFQVPLHDGVTVKGEYAVKLIGVYVDRKLIFLTPTQIMHST